LKGCLFLIFTINKIARKKNPLKIRRKIAYVWQVKNKKFYGEVENEYGKKIAAVSGNTLNEIKRLVKERGANYIKRVISDSPSSI